MMGSTLLVMPHVFHSSGWLLTLAISALVCALSTHTADLILHHATGLMADDSAELGDLAQLNLGRTSKWITFYTGVVVLLGAACAMHGYTREVFSHLIAYPPVRGGLCFAAVHTDPDAQSPCEAALGSETIANVIYSCASLPITVPLANLPTIRLLARIGAVGVLCFLIILLFAFTSAGVSAAQHGIQATTNSTDYWRPEDASIAFGIFSLSFFIHNAIMTIMRGAASPQHNRRDVSVAFLLVWLCYVAMGVCSNLFPPSGDLDALGSELAANGLISLPQPAVMAPVLVIARVAVLIQSVSVYPVLLFIVRSQVFSALVYKKPYPGWLPVLLFSLFEAAITTSVTIAQVPISVILKYVGSLGGLVCVYAVPALVHAAVHCRNGTFSPRVFLQVSLICGYGIYSLVVQLIPTTAAD